MFHGVLFPRTCPACGLRGAAPCGRCAAELRRPPVLPCPAGVDSCTALLAYEGVAREMVARLKYRNARSVLTPLVEAMASLVDPRHIDIVTWAPTTARRRRDRGFDQAQLLAQGVARRLRRPCRRLLKRVPGPAQTGRAGSERRRHGPAFTVRGPGRIGLRVLMVDDVVTSGATVTAGATALRRAGAAEVHVLAAARTPAPSSVRAGVGAPLHSRMTVCGSVVESRSQSQAKRPT